jgi:NADPH-dependent ferric siderophore reductase
VARFVHPRAEFPARVAAVERVVPKVARVTFAGDALRDLPAPSPGGHVRVFFGAVQPEDDRDARHARRTLTPRRFDPERGELVVEVVLHGAGLASGWAERVAVGDPVVLSGAGGRYRPQAVDGAFVIAVDDTGIPAAGTVVEALPDDVHLTALCEVTDETDERPLSPTRWVPVTWLHRSTTGADPGSLLEAAVAALPADLRAGWFGAAEARTVRRLDRHLREDRGAVDGTIEARGYWRHREVD